ncbi:hypothetical protein [Microbulbifer magnicolonia]|uniref:hypothetical protein n=1 Tax=Microbulbifer magnicolonia TaxID=3109744 RepID=UPI002B407065|nr:hypothetical protein [Microbulbifer sp. GG15]
MEFCVDGFCRYGQARCTMDFTTGHGAGAVTGAAAAGLFTGFERFARITGIAVMGGHTGNAVIAGGQIGILVVAIITFTSRRAGCCKSLTVKGQ